LGKLTKATTLVLALMLGACAGTPQSESPTLPDHCETTIHYADLAMEANQQLLQQNKETRELTASYNVESCDLLYDETKAVSILTLTIKNDDETISEMGIVVFLEKEEEWTIVKYDTLYMEVYLK
jgi:hypothetical protein